MSFNENFRPLRLAWNPQEIAPNFSPRPLASFSQLFVVGFVRINCPFRTVDDSTSQQLQHFPVSALGIKVEFDGAL